MNYNDRYGSGIFINREHGVEPSIHESVILNGLIDCIHKIVLEKDVFFGHDVKLLTGGHDYRLFGVARKRSNGGGPITIHEGVWVASFAIIIGPCEIGKHAVIGAGSVVRGKVPEYAVMIGNPAQKVKDIAHE